MVNQTPDNSPLEWTGERFIPWSENAYSSYVHIHRYAFAAGFVKGKTVLDLGSGEGYGTYILSKEANTCVGIEIDKQALHHATNKYKRNNLTYIQGSILDIPIKDESKFDVVVCFEVIEHIKEQDQVLSEVNRILKEDGLFIISSPDRIVASWPYKYHIKELSFDEFKTLMYSHFKQVTYYGQKVYTGSNIWQLSPNEQLRNEEYFLKKEDKEFCFTDKSNTPPNYNIALASKTIKKPQLLGVTSWLLDTSETQNLEHQKQIDILNKQIDILNKQIDILNNIIKANDLELTQIRKSVVVQVLGRYYSIMDKILPQGSRRRRYYELPISYVRIILSEGWRRFVSKEINKITTQNPSVIYNKYKFTPGKNILLITHELSLSGAPIALFNLAVFLKNHKYFPILISPSYGKLSADFKKSKIPVVIDPSVFDNPADETVNFIRKFDLVIANTVFAWQSVNIRRERGLPIIWLIHESEYGRDLAEKNIMVARALTSANVVMFPSRYTANLYHNFNKKDNFKVLYYGIEPLVTNISKYKKSNLLRIITIGTIESRKGQDILIKSIKTLSEQINNKCEFIFIGRVLEADYYSKLVESSKSMNNIHFLDQLPQKQLFEYYRTCDIYVCCSRDEGLPLTLMEVMSQGKAVISTAVGGIPELIEDGKDGILVPREDVESLAKALTLLINDPALRENLGKNAVKKYQDSFTLEKLEARFIPLVNQLINYNDVR